MSSHGTESHERKSSFQGQEIRPVMRSTFWKDTDAPSLIQPFKYSPISLFLIHMRQDLVLQSILVFTFRPDPARGFHIGTTVFAWYDELRLELDLSIGNDFFDGGRRVAGGFGKDELRPGFDFGGEACVDTGNDERVRVREDDPAVSSFCVISSSSDGY